MISQAINKRHIKHSAQIKLLKIKRTRMHGPKKENAAGLADDVVRYNFTTLPCDVTDVRKDRVASLTQLNPFSSKPINQLNRDHQTHLTTIHNDRVRCPWSLDDHRRH